MSNKKNQRRSGRNVKVPMKLNDHVIGNLNSRRTDNVSEVTEKEARVTGIGESIESGVKSIGKDEIVHGELQVDKEVNATVSNSQTPTVNNIVDSVIVDIDSNSGDKLVNTVNDTNKSVNSMLNGDDAHANRVEKNVNAMSYAKMVTKDEVPTKLTFVPTVTTELGNKIEKENNDKAKEGMESHNGKNVEDKNEVGMQGRRFINRYQANPYKYAATQKNDSMNKGQAKDGFKNTNMGFKRQEYKRKQNGNSNVLNEKGQSSNYENEAGVKSTNKYDMLNGLGNENEELDKSKVDEELNGDIEDVLEGTSGGAKVLSADEVSDGTRSISEEYNVEFPPIPTSHNQYVALIEEYKRRPDVSLLWQKEQTLVEKLVNNKKIPAIEETKIWPLRMFEIYKEGWEAKWKTECPFIGNFQE
ncbi:hypothetical protein CTI12_AA027750 [Artemisia annua]|uniref:Uncharacterized protein n=1 Tax=Artemisia annua TaxID=35608 RepID=A0A2U1QEX1_ARTAN|nr:hypothetical protein CTI12_AA027750 [Artemisia annua]